MNRRTFLTALGAVLAAGPTWAAWPEKAFESKEAEDVLSKISSGKPKTSDRIIIDAPDIAENGAVVPISVSTGLSDVTKMSIVVESNPQPLNSTYDLTDQSVPFVSTRVKMLKTSNVIALVEAGGKTYVNTREVKVTIGGCGG